MHPTKPLTTVDTPARGPLSNLSPAAAALARASLATNTIRAYRTAVRLLEEALQGQSLTDDTLAEYLTARHHAGAAPATLALTVAAVRFAAEARGMPAPIGPATTAVLAGARREGRGRGRGQVKGLQWGETDQAAALAASDGLRGLRDAALLALASECVLRIGEVVAVQVEHVETIGDGSGRLFLPFSKTDQEGVGEERYIGPPTMKRLAEWRRAGSVEHGPLFRRIRHGDNVQATAISERAARDIIRDRAAAAGIEGRISGHSPRVGAAQSMAAAGAGIVEMQTAGGWASADMPAHYARGQMAARGAVARLRHGVTEPGEER